MVSTGVIADALFKVQKMTIHAFNFDGPITVAINVKTT